MNKVIMYLDKNKDEELEIQISSDSFNHQAVCDLCSRSDDLFSFFPELGHKVLCQKCAKEHKHTVKWHTEDLHPVFNSLISFIQTYDFGWSQVDYDKIDEFFSSKGHYSLHIKKFMEK